MNTQATFDLGEPALTKRQAARRLGLSPRYLDELCSAGVGPAHYLFGKKRVFHAADLDAYAAAHRVEAAYSFSRPSGEEGMMVAPFACRSSRLLTNHRVKHRLPLLRAVCEHGVGLVFVRPETRRADPPRRSAFVAIVEDCPPSRGPAAFDPLSLRALLQAVHGVVVICNPSAAWPYRTTATLVGMGVSSLLVETTAERGKAWRTFVNATAPTLPVALIRV